MSFTSGLPIRKSAIDAVVSLLSDPENGYNATFPKVLTSGGYPELTVVPNDIDFAADSRSFVKSYLFGVADVDLSRMCDPLVLVIYTSQVENRGLVMGHRFAGICLTHVDIYLRQQAQRFAMALDDEQTGALQVPGMEDGDTETLVAAVEDTIMSVLHAPDAQWPSSVVYGWVWQSNTTPLFQLPDGFQQAIQIQLQLEVRIP